MAAQQVNQEFRRLMNRLQSLAINLDENQIESAENAVQVILNTQDECHNVFFMTIAEMRELQEKVDAAFNAFKRAFPNYFDELNDEIEND